MRAALALQLLATLALALSGCSGDTHRPPPSSSGGPQDPGTTAEPEADNAVFQVSFRAAAGAVVEAPFPHLDSCLQPEDWMNGTTKVQGAVPELRDASAGRTGRVLALTAQAAGDVQWQSQIPLASHHQCQTLRYDPWSTDPDPEGDAVEVHVAGDASGFSVLARWVRGGCGNATLYEGSAADGAWSPLPGRTIPAGCG